MKDPDTDPRPYASPLLTMHTTDARDRLWVTCSCGWEADPIEVRSPDSWVVSQTCMAALGRKHLLVEHMPSDTPTGAPNP